MSQLQHPIVRCLEAHDVRTIDEVARDTGLSRRAVEAEVEDLRLAGHPIVGGPEGLHLTRDPGELAAYLEGRRRRAAAIHRGTMALRTTLRRLEAPGTEQLAMAL